MMNFNISELGEDVSERVVEFDVAEDRRTLEVAECCDSYFSADLNKAQVALLIGRLQVMHDQMVEA